jgi:signal transduction histidine kinase
LGQLGQLVDCDACAIWLRSNARLRLVASRGSQDLASVERFHFDLEAHPALGQLLQAGRPLVLSDLTREGPFAGSGDFGGMRACIAVPLMYQGRPIGLLLVLKKEADCYSEGDAHTALVVANQAAMAIENAPLYAESRRRALQLEAVSHVGRKVISILAMDDLLVEVVRLIQEKLGFYHVHLFLVDGPANEIVLREASGHVHDVLKRRGLRLKIGKEGITGWVAATGKPLLCNDVSREARYHPHELLPETQSELAVPLQVGDVVIGVLDVQSHHLDFFHEDDVTALQILADQVAIAIENAHLFEQTRRQYEALRALHTISLDITSRLEAQEVLAAVLEQATLLLRAQASSLGLLDREAGVVRLIAIHNQPPQYQDVAVPVGEGAAGKVVTTGQPVIVNDYRHWPERSPVFRGSSYDAIVCVPLCWEGQVFGTLSVLDQGQRRPFTEEDAQLLGLFADLATIALKNAELYGQVRQAGEALEQKVEQRTQELARAREELAHKAEQLRRLLASTIHVQEEERTRIARDLHDGSNQLITGTLYEIQAAQESIANQRPQVALQKLEIAKGLLRTIEAENRRIISGLRPSVLDAQGLVPALKWLANDFQKRYGVVCKMRVTGEPVRLSSDAETAIYRIVQESLNNVAAHARAQRVGVEVDFKPEHLRVVVEDDGVGFDYGRVLAAMKGQMGLIGIRERAESIGGQVEIHSAPGAGTRLALTAPFGAGALHSL